MRGAGIADVSDSAKGSATGFSSRPFSYGGWVFPAMAVNRAVYSHPGRVDLTRASVPDSGDHVAGPIVRQRYGGAVHPGRVCPVVVWSRAE